MLRRGPDAGVETAPLGNRKLAKSGPGKSWRTFKTKISNDKAKKKENANVYLNLFKEKVNEYKIDINRDDFPREMISYNNKLIAGQSRDAEVSDTTEAHIEEKLENYLKEVNPKRVDLIKDHFIEKCVDVGDKEEEVLKDPVQREEFLKKQVPPEILDEINSYKDNRKCFFTDETFNKLDEKMAKSIDVAIKADNADSVKFIKEHRLGLSNIYGDKNNIPRALTRLFNVAENRTKSRIDSDKLLSNAQSIIKIDLAKRNGEYVDEALGHIDYLLSRVGLNEDDPDPGMVGLSRNDPVVKPIFEAAEKDKASGYLLSKNDHWSQAIYTAVNDAIDTAILDRNKKTVEDLIEKMGGKEEIPSYMMDIFEKRINSGEIINFSEKEEALFREEIMEHKLKSLREQS